MSARHFTLDKVVFYGRTLAEYRRVFQLTDEELRGERVLDCPGGPDSFGAEARDLGCQVVSCDPVYAHSIDDVAARGRQDIEETIDRVRAGRHFQSEDWDLQKRNKLAALERFVADYRARAGDGSGAYLAAKLPHLPLPDASFDLVLSAHLLFVYSSTGAGGLLAHDGLDLDFHRRAIRELIRLCRGEIRIYPTATVDEHARRHPFASQIAHELAQEGYQVAFRRSNYTQGVKDFNDYMSIMVPRP